MLRPPFLLALLFSIARLSSAEVVTYEAFGAKGDGVADDLPAIVAAHAYANEHGLPVKTKPDATYNLGRRALTAVIATDTDWGPRNFSSKIPTSRITRNRSLS